MSTSSRSLLAKANSEFYLYDTDHITQVESVSNNFTLFSGVANFFFVPPKVDSKKTRNKLPDELPEYILEVDATDEIMKFIKGKEQIGCVFKNSLDKNPNIYQIFEMEIVESDNPKKIAFKAIKAGAKYAISYPLQMDFDKYIELIKENHMYLVEKC